jgi:hypothetical protein
VMDWVDMTNKTEKIRENRLRGAAAHFGIRMTKSRVALSLDNHGGYMLVNASRNAVVIGSRFRRSRGVPGEIVPAVATMSVGADCACGCHQATRAAAVAVKEASISSQSARSISVGNHEPSQQPVRLLRTRRERPRHRRAATVVCRGDHRSGL